MILWDKVVSLSGDWVSRKEAEERIRKYTALLEKLEGLADWLQFNHEPEMATHIRAIIEQEKGDD